MATVAAIGRVPAAINAGIYENRSTMWPMRMVKTVLIMPAPNPLRPVTVATTSGANKSLGKVKPIVDQLAYPSKAIQMSANATPGVLTKTAGMPANMGMQLYTQTRIRALSTGTCLRINHPDKPPPIKLPRSAATKGIQANIAICFRLNPRASLKYCGNQKTKNHQTGSVSERPMTTPHVFRCPINRRRADNCSATVGGLDVAWAGGRLG